MKTQVLTFFKISGKYLSSSKGILRNKRLGCLYIRGDKNVLGLKIKYKFDTFVQFFMHNLVFSFLFFLKKGQARHYMIN